MPQPPWAAHCHGVAPRGPGPPPPTTRQERPPRGPGATAQTPTGGDTLCRRCSPSPPSRHRSFVGAFVGAVTNSLETSVIPPPSRGAPRGICRQPSRGRVSRCARVGACGHHPPPLCRSGHFTPRAAAALHLPLYHSRLGGPCRPRGFRLPHCNQRIPQSNVAEMYAPGRVQEIHEVGVVLLVARINSPFCPCRCERRKVEASPLPESL